jgi:hypothetical protein
VNRFGSERVPNSKDCIFTGGNNFFAIFSEDSIGYGLLMTLEGGHKLSIICIMDPDTSISSS